MTSKQIILNAVALKPTPRLPVALLSGGVWALNRQGLSLQAALEGGAQQTAQILADTNQEVRSDIVWLGSGYHNIGIYALGGQIKFRAKGAPDVVAPLVQEISELDFKLLDRLSENKELNVLWDTTPFLVEAIGSHTLVGASQWGPFTLAGHIFGVEKLMRSIYKDPAAVYDVLDFASELCYRYLEPFIDKGAEIVSVADPTSSGDLISLQQFSDFSFPYLKKVIEKLKARGVAVTVHICGNINNRVHLIPDTGADILSVDYKVDLAAAKQALADRILLAGNMNPVAVMQNETPAGVAAACRDCIDKVGEGSHYLLMPGCDIPPGVPLENIKTMVDIAHSVHRH